MKRSRHEPVLRFKKPISIKNMLETFYKKVKKTKLENIICIDETSLSTALQRNRCYSVKGTRCIIKTSTPDVFVKYTGIFAISKNGCIGWKLYDKGGINSERLIDFINTNIKGKNKLIIMDNASSHRNSKVKEIVTQNNNLLYSVPYQPYTNGIENFFSILKSHLRKIKATNFKTLEKNIKNVLKNIQNKTCSNIVNGAYRRKQNYVPKKVSKKISKYYKKSAF